MNNLLNNFQNFVQNFRGKNPQANPQQMVQQLLNSGQMSQQQYNDLAAKANKIMPMLRQMGIKI